MKKPKHEFGKEFAVDEFGLAEGEFRLTDLEGLVSYALRRLYPAKFLQQLGEITGGAARLGDSTITQSPVFSPATYTMVFSTYPVIAETASWHKTFGEFTIGFHQNLLSDNAMPIAMTMGVITTQKYRGFHPLVQNGGGEVLLLYDSYVSGFGYTRHFRRDSHRSRLESRAIKFP